MGNGLGIRFSGDLNQALGNERARDTRSQQILALIQRVTTKHRKHKISNKFFTNIVYEDFLNPHTLGFFSCRLELLALTQIRGIGHHLAVIGLLQPTQNDRCIQAT